MTWIESRKEAKRRGFSYVGSMCEVYHPSDRKGTKVVFELEYEATDYIGEVVSEKGAVYASQLMVKKIIIDNPACVIKRGRCFVQWVKPVKEIKTVVKVSYTVKI